MSCSLEALVISPADTLPTAALNLMPFHIDYSGPAPISTYFRPKVCSAPTFGRDTRPLPPPRLSSKIEEESDSQATLVGSVEGSSSSVTTLGSASMVVGADTTQGEGLSATSATDTKHYVASFRGREMRGMAVDLPAGYAGIVLRVPDGKKGHVVASGSKMRVEQKPKSKGKATRRSKRVQEEVKVEDEDEEMDASQMPGTASEFGPTRVLEPVSTFSTFLLWNPDMSVDEGRDEYVRSLKEWTRLAAEIHRVEDC